MLGKRRCWRIALEVFARAIIRVNFRPVTTGQLIELLASLGGVEPLRVRVCFWVECLARGFTFVPIEDALAASCACRTGVGEMRHALVSIGVVGRRRSHVRGADCHVDRQFST